MTSDKQFIKPYLLNLRPYKTATQEIWTRDPGEWDEILKLDWNEAAIEPAPEVKAAILSFVNSREFFHLYPSTFNPELLSLLSKYADVPESNIQFFASSDALHEYIVKAYVEVGDKVLILWPSYDNFRAAAEAGGAKVVYSDLDEEFHLNIEKFEKDIRNEKPRIVYICNPNNPSGSLISQDEILSILSKYPDILFVLDEAYAEFARQTCNRYVLSHENLLVTHTLSKAFALANIRFGYLVASEDHVDAVNRIRNPKSIPTLTQIAAAEALRNTDYMQAYVKEVEAAREWFLDALNRAELTKRIKAYPSRSNFVLIQCHDIITKSAICYALRDNNIYVRQLNQNASLLTCFRVTVGKRDQMRKVFEVIRQVLNERK